MDSINNLQVTPLRYRNLDNKVDVSAQVGDINSSYREAVEGTRGLSDARTAAMMKGTFASNRVNALNTVRETANNASREITNQNITAINAYDAQNASAADALNKYKLEAQVGLNNAKIAGRNQTVDNIYSILKDKNLSDNDKYTMDLIIKTVGNKRSISRYLAQQYERITGTKYTGEISE